MTDLIVEYRKILDEVLNDIQPDDTSNIRLRWTTGEPEVFKNQRMSHEFADQVYYHTLEARMQLGNLLKYISNQPNPYEEAARRRVRGESDEIPEPEHTCDPDLALLDFDNKVSTLDYLRELLESINYILDDIRDKVEDVRATIHLDEAISNLSLARNYCGKILECIKNIREVKNEQPS